MLLSFSSSTCSGVSASPPVSSGARVRTMTAESLICTSTGEVMRSLGTLPYELSISSRFWCGCVATLSYGTW